MHEQNSLSIPDPWQNTLAWQLDKPGIITISNRAVSQ